MNKFGKTIKLFLLDADPDGRIICELSNWTGKAYRIPRGKVKDCSNRDELKTTAVYLLFGKADSSTSKAKVYIGEAENAYSRLVQHVSEKEFWNESVVFISKDENLNKAHIKYLESRLHEITQLADRYELINGNTPTRSSISESDKAEMEEYIEYIKMLVNTMGFKVFESIVKDNAGAAEANSCLFIKGARGANAQGRRVSDGFVVLKNSEIAYETVPSFPNSFKTLRSDLIESKVITHSDNKFLFMDDYLFSSPSSAAAIVMGRNANGLLEWKDSSGKDLKTIEAAEIKNAEEFEQVNL